MFWKRKKPESKYSVVGAVYVQAAGTAHRHLVRLNPGEPVKILERFTGSDRSSRLRIEDGLGRRGECCASDVWEHVGCA